MFLSSRLWKAQARRLKIFSLLTAAILGGYAAAGIEQMSVLTQILQSTNSPLKKSVAIASVTGGGETNPMWSSGVSSESSKTNIQLLVNELLRFQPSH